MAETTGCSLQEISKCGAKCGYKSKKTSGKCIRYALHFLVLMGYCILLVFIGQDKCGLNHWNPNSCKHRKMDVKPIDYDETRYKKQLSKCCLSSLTSHSTVRCTFLPSFDPWAQCPLVSTNDHAPHELSPFGSCQMHQHIKSVHNAKSIASVWDDIHRDGTSTSLTLIL